MAKVGIVGSGEDKFSGSGAFMAAGLIDELVAKADVILSGHSPVGGVDIWAEESAIEQGVPTDIKVPEQHKWDAPYGYKARNLDIAQESDIVHIIVVDKYPEDYTGMRFKKCYHCNTDEHIKSGGCWTGKKAIEFGNEAVWHIIENE